jgi:LacI family transcriptional regulator
MTKPLRIGLVFEYNLAYPRGVLRGIKQFAQTKPHWILVPLDTEGLTVQALRAVQPAGLIALVVSDTLADALGSVRRPLVNVASVLTDLPFPRVGVDHRQVGRLAASHLRERGFRHFGFVGHPHHFYSIEREVGFRQALALKSHSLACYHERPARSYRQRGRLLVLNEGLQRWLRTLPKPVGVFACHDVWGVQVVEACRLMRLRVPDDVAVVGVDNDDLLCELARPSLSSIIVPAERIGYEAASLLQRLLRRAGRNANPLAKPPLKPLLIPPFGVVTRQSSDVLAGGDTDVTAAVRFIRDHGHLPLSVEDVLRVVPVSRRFLERRFRALLERGVGKEIRRVHLARTKNLLATTALSMAEIAEQSGFSSVHYLSRVFRQETGLTPTAFRRQASNLPGLENASPSTTRRP